MEHAAAATGAGVTAAIRGREPARNAESTPERHSTAPNTEKCWKRREPRATSSLRGRKRFHGEENSTNISFSHLHRRALEEGYRSDTERLKTPISPKTKLSYICNTHNPAGRVMTEEELRGIAVDEGFYVFVDEFWEDILTATIKEDHERGPGPHREGHPPPREDEQATSYPPHLLPRGHNLCEQKPANTQIDKSTHSISDRWQGSW